MLDFALLAPVPADYLLEGVKVSRESGYVSYGSKKWQLFREINERRAGEKVPALLYASHENVEMRTDFEVSYIAWYIGSTENKKEMRNDESNGHRPESALSDYNDKAIKWATFWRVENVQKLPQNLLIRVTEIQTLHNGKPRKNYAPYGPEIIRFDPKWEEIFNHPFIEAMPSENEAEPTVLEAIDKPEPPSRTTVTTQRIIRDTAKTKELKKLYQNTCQVCGTRLQINAGTYYSEVHHLRPLGGDHNGLDDYSNMLVLCPNHHALFDFAVPLLHLDHKTILVELAGEKHPLLQKHAVDLQNIHYHNELAKALRDK